MNYYSREANLKYMSVSQIKKFIGCPAKHGCEAEAVAELYGEYAPPASDALTFGSYIDVQLTGTDEEKVEFVETHPEMFKKNGELYAKYDRANDMIARVQADADRGGVFLKYLEGEKQKVYTGEIGGFEFKARLDALGANWICDLKTTESITKKYYSNGWYNFIDYWGYTLQGAVYQELVFQNTGRRLPFYIAAVSKETDPDLGVFHIPQDALDRALSELTPEVLSRIDALKKRELEPERCERCGFCKVTKVIERPVNYLEIGE